MKESFGKVLLPIYDRLVLEGEITFSSLGMSKEDFTKMCVDEFFIPDEKVVIGLIENLNLTAEEEINLRRFIM